MVMLTIIDSGVANLRSVVNTLRFLGVEPHIAHNPAELADADKVILPGVGAFGAGMANLRERGFVEPIREIAAKGVPLLGICLGMQLLFARSFELGEFEGLGLLQGEIVRFPADGPKVPHIGWNQLHYPNNTRLLRNVTQGSYAYFVHSFYARIPDPAIILAYTDYGINFPAVVGRGNVFGAQFHPEKSQATGQTLLKNFLAL
jgi:glutamine amidotransferase